MATELRCCLLWEAFPDVFILNLHKVPLFLFPSTLTFRLLLNSGSSTNISHRWTVYSSDSTYLWSYQKNGAHLPLTFSSGTKRAILQQCRTDFIRITCRVCYTWSSPSAPTPKWSCFLRQSIHQNLTDRALRHVACFDQWDVGRSEGGLVWNRGFKGHRLCLFTLCFYHLPWKEEAPGGCCPFILCPRMRDEEQTWT